MSRKRGRPRKIQVLPTHPNKVISTAMKRGLSSAVELQRDIKNKNTFGLFESSQNILSHAMSEYYQTVRAGKSDLSPIIQVEKNVRRNILDMFWEVASAYGNTEIKRVKKSDETIGPLNQRFNTCGAELRNFGMTMFPFPNPEFFGYQMRNIDGKETTFRSAGYRRDSYGPHTPLVHPDLPSLDFVDAVRHHLDYLATFCYKYDVPPRETGRYWNLYQQRARPFLEHIYSECSSGKKGFREGTRHVLRRIKEDIMNHYKIRSGDVPTVTGSIDIPRPSFSTDFFSNIITEARSKGINDSAIDELERLHTTFPPHEVDKKDDDESRETYLRERDVRNIWQRLSKRVTKTGSQVHRTISSQLSGPWNLRNVIMNGDSLGSDDGFLVSFEVPVDTELGKGKVDIILSERVSLKNETRVFQRPVMVFEIKTKMGHSMTLGRKDIHSESRKRYSLDQRVVADFRFDDRVLDSDEWESIIKATPIEKTTKKQLDVYSDAIWKEYQKLTSSEEPHALITGTILVEATEEIRLVRDMLRSLVINIYDEVVKHKDHRHRLVFEPTVRGQSVRVAVVINERPRSIALDGSTILPDWCPVYDPLQTTSLSGRRFIMHLDGQSPTSSGISAGWIAKFHHGLYQVKDIVEREGGLDTVWIDLADQFVDPQLAEARLYLKPCSKKEVDVQRSHREDIQHLFESIPIMGLFSDVNSFLFEGKPISSIQTRLRELPQKECLIIVSGMETLRDATPEFHRWRLELLLSGIISNLPNHRSVTVLWFDSPVPGESYSTAYSSRTLLPFYESTVLNGVVNEIVWNLPVVSGYDADPENWPLPTLAKTPYHDDIRVIVTQDRNGFSIESTLVPILTDWSKRFRAEGLGEVTPVEDVSQIVPDASVRARMEILALSLIPWLAKLWPKQKLDEGHGSSISQKRYDQETSRYLIEREHISLRVRTFKGRIGKEPTLLQRVRFRPEQTRGGRSFVEVTLGAINSQRLYRRHRRIRTKPKTLVETPSPSVREELTDLSDIRFGLTLSSEDLGHEWRAVVNPNVSAPLKIGLFKVKEEAQASLDWSVSRLDIVSKMGRELGRFDDSVKEFLFRRNPDYNKDDSPDESQWFAWSRLEGDVEWIPAGLNDHILRSSSSKTSLRAFGLKGDCEMSSVSIPALEFPEGLKEAIQEAIDRSSRQLSHVKHVGLQLEIKGKECIVQFFDPQSGQTMQSLRMTNTADLIGLLRWPMTEGKPLRLRNDLLVSWDPFHDFSYPSPDINFGKDFKFLEPLLISLTKSEGMVLSPVILDTTLDHRAIQITISHYPTQCPLVEGMDNNHASCWGVELLSETQYLNMINTEHYLTDREVLEGVEKLAQSIGSRHVDIVFDHGPDKDDRLVFNESEVMREISREYRGIPMQNFAPGHTVRIKLMKKRHEGKLRGPDFIPGTDVPQ
ncbi:MAG: hypothetical protein E3J86_02550 [Candidatus Thorarchaeota archaeon]|nr:MAG: hypothetical protein E3J86_02550 [Candidatus Thorarchaeota archaeon]